MNQWFLQSEYAQAPVLDAAFHIIPVPLERTVSYGGGTSGGPQAIIDASEQLEREVEGFGEPGSHGIFTHAAIDCSPERTTDEIFTETAQIMQDVYQNGGIPILLGGEHSVTNGALPFLSTLQEKFPIGILQFDAHMDLRDTYEGSPESHACVMRRAVEQGIRLHQVGIRNFSSEERLARKHYAVSSHDASLLWRLRNSDAIILPPNFPQHLYITFDVDAFDASMMSATGTPDPGGLLWWQAVELLEKLTQGRTIVGCDVVELAPVERLHHCDYTAAKLTYFLMGLIAQRNQFPHDRTSS